MQVIMRMPTNNKQYGAPEPPDLIATLDPLPPAPVTAALDAFEAAVGGRASLRAAIEANPTLKTYEQRLVQSLSRKNLEHTPLIALCVEADCTIGQLFTAYKNGQLAKAHVQAIEKIAAKVPAIIEDILDSCTTTTQPCAICEGSGEQGEADGVHDCAVCKGTGSVVVASSLDHQKVILGLLGFLQKGGVTVQTNVQTNVVTPSGGRPGGTLDRLQEVVSGIVRQPLVLDVESAPETP